MQVKELKNILNTAFIKINAAYYNKNGKDFPSVGYSRIGALTKQGDIYHFVLNMKNQQDIEQKLGVKSLITVVKDLEEYGLLDPNDRSSIYELKKGDKLGTFQICALARNFNQMIGMHLCDARHGFPKPFVIVKADDKRRKHADKYKDRWLEYGISYCYYFQHEEKASDGLSGFVNRANVSIVDAINRQNSSERLPIHLFTRSAGQDLFIYQGAFYANRFLYENRAVELIKI